MVTFFFSSQMVFMLSFVSDENCTTTNNTDKYRFTSLCAGLRKSGRNVANKSSAPVHRGLQNGKNSSRTTRVQPLLSVLRLNLLRHDLQRYGQWDVISFYTASLQQVPIWQPLLRRTRLLTWVWVMAHMANGYSVGLSQCPFISFLLTGPLIWQGRLDTDLWGLSLCQILWFLFVFLHWLLYST